MAETSIGLSKEVKDKLESIKGDMTFNDYFQKIIASEEGAIVNDITEIKRPKIAITVEYEGHSWDNETNYIHESNNLDITFQDLFNSKIGDCFEAKHKKNTYFLNEKAEVIFKDNKTCFLRVEIETNTPTKHIKEYELVHIELF